MRRRESAPTAGCETAKNSVMAKVCIRPAPPPVGETYRGMIRARALSEQIYPCARVPRPSPLPLTSLWKQSIRDT
eukprot:scaffold17108_cov139-Isochrysis_galbana.AAC.3